MKKEYDIDLIFSLYKDGVLCKEIAKKVNLSVSYVKTLLVKHRKEVGYRKEKIFSNKEHYDKVIDLYKKGYSYSDISKMSHISVQKVGLILINQKNQKKLSVRKINFTKKGENHNRAKLTEGDVINILALRLDGFSYKNLSLKFNVTTSLIMQICKGKVWKETFEKCKDWYILA